MTPAKNIQTNMEHYIMEVVKELLDKVKDQLVLIVRKENLKKLCQVQNNSPQSLIIPPKSIYNH
jgi:hypothetical protein